MNKPCTTMETKRKTIFSKREEVKIDPDMPDYSDHPFFIEKKRWAIEFVKKTNLIEQLRERASRD